MADNNNPPASAFDGRDGAMDADNNNQAGQWDWASRARAIPRGYRTAELRAQIATMSPLRQQIAVGTAIYSEVGYLRQEMADIVTTVMVRSLGIEELLHLLDDDQLFHAVVLEVASDPLHYYMPQVSAETTNAPRRFTPRTAGFDLAGGEEVHHRPAHDARNNRVLPDDNYLATLGYRDGWLTCTNGPYEVALHVRKLVGAVLLVCSIALYVAWAIGKQC